MNSSMEHNYSPDPERMAIFFSKIEEMRSLMNVLSKKGRGPLLENSDTNGEDRDEDSKETGGDEENSKENEGNEEDSEETGGDEEGPVPFDPRD